MTFKAIIRVFAYNEAKQIIKKTKVKFVDADSAFQAKQKLDVAPNLILKLTHYEPKT